MGPTSNGNMRITLIPNPPWELLYFKKGKWSVSEGILLPGLRLAKKPIISLLYFLEIPVFIQIIDGVGCPWPWETWR
jgi:hypothetical protein